MSDLTLTRDEAPACIQRFQVGAVYTARSLCDYEIVWAFTVLSRTHKFITILEHSSPEKPKRVGVKIHNGEEYALPLGSYSMAPAIHAGRA
jgi:hypothetical protein